MVTRAHGRLALTKACLKWNKQNCWWARMEDRESSTAEKWGRLPQQPGGLNPQVLLSPSAFGMCNKKGWWRSWPSTSEAQRGHKCWGHSTLQPLLIPTTVTANTFLDDCPGHVLWLMRTLGERSPQTPKQTLTMFKAHGASPSLFPLSSLCRVEHTLCTSYVWD